jgi:hypothetical protein
MLCSVLFLVMPNTESTPLQLKDLLCAACDELCVDTNASVYNEYVFGMPLLKRAGEAIEIANG